MTWRGPRLTDDQREVADLVGAFVSRHTVDLDDARPEEIGALRGELAELGVWTMGAAQEHGGGGAAPDVTLAVTEGLARSWPALAWAFVQTQVAVDLLATEPRLASTVDALHSGVGAVAVVAAESAQVHLQWSGGRLEGTADRVDVAAERPALLLLVSDSSALFVGTPTTVTPLERTGLAGALTRSVEIETDDVVELTGLDIPAARTRLRLGGAAVAAGIAGAAVDQAIDYTSARHQFGAFLTAIGTVRQSLFTQATRTSTALSATLAASTTGVTPAVAAGLLTQSCQDAIDICAMALQAHGGYGYLREYPAERHLRDAVSLRAAVDAFGVGITGARELVGIATASTLDGRRSTDE